jgi:hypothetical protein
VRLDSRIPAPPHARLRSGGRQAAIRIRLAAHPTASHEFVCGSSPSPIGHRSASTLPIRVCSTDCRCESSGFGPHGDRAATMAPRIIRDLAAAGRCCLVRRLCHSARAVRRTHHDGPTLAHPLTKTNRLHTQSNTALLQIQKDVKQGEQRDSSSSGRHSAALEGPPSAAEFLNSSPATHSGMQHQCSAHPPRIACTSQRRVGPRRGAMCALCAHSNEYEQHVDRLSPLAFWILLLLS